MQAGNTGDEVHVAEDVPHDQHAIGLAPEGDVSDGVPRGLQHREPRDLIALPQRACDGVGGSGPHALLQPIQPAGGLGVFDPPRGLHSGHVPLAAPQWDPEALADRVA